MSTEKQQDLYWIPSFYRESNVTGKYSVIDHPEIKNEIFYTDYDGTHHIRVMKSFQTPDELNYLNHREEWVRRQDTQKDFFLRCYLPKSKISYKDKTHRIRHVIVMFNGLNECEKYDFYDAMGAQFAEYGIATILLPTPYHLNRRIKKIKKTETDEKPDPKSMVRPNTKEYELPTDMAYDHPELYFYNFKRSIREFEELVKRIEKPDRKDHGFFENYFERNPEITLFGFSLGGLRAVSCFLRNPEKYHSCVTFNSGVNLREINTKGLHLNAKRWKETWKTVEDWFDNAKFLRNENSENNEILDFFRRLYLGREKPELSDKLFTYTDKYFSIQSGDDSLFKDKKPMNECLVPGEVLHSLTIAGVGHIPAMDLRWDKWLSKVGENIVHFIQGVKDVHWTHGDLEKEIKKLIRGTQFLADIQKASDEAAENGENYFESYDFSLAEFEKLKRQIKNNKKDAKKFAELYYISKTFYPTFSEVLEKITKH